MENRGQTDPRVALYLPGKDNTLYFAPDGLTLAFTTAPKPGSAGMALPDPAVPARQRWAVKLDFVGANANVQPTGEAPTPAVFSYFRGEASQWRAGVPTFSQLRYRDLWPGIDLTYSGQASN